MGRVKHWINWETRFLTYILEFYINPLEVFEVDLQSEILIIKHSISGLLFDRQFYIDIQRWGYIESSKAYNYLNMLTEHCSVYCTVKSVKYKSARN